MELRTVGRGGCEHNKQGAETTEDERGESSTDQSWGWGQGEEIMSSAKFTPSWPDSSHNNQSPTHLPPSSPQLPSKWGFLSAASTLGLGLAKRLSSEQPR